MTDTAGTAPRPAKKADEPRVRALTSDDISHALTSGMRDFRAAPSFGFVFGGLYAVGGLLITYMVMSLGWYYFAYPLAAGFALVAPLVAVGLYEVSRMLEKAETPTWPSVISAIRRHASRDLGYMAVVAVFGMIIWVDSAGFLYAMFFGMKSISVPELITAVTTTPSGVVFLVVGNLIGAFIAGVLFSVSVVSYPMLVDQNVDFVTAMITSVKAVAASPAAMIGWAAFIACMLVVAIIPMFLGLVIVLPLLGHATWHIYRRVVERKSDLAA